MTSTHPPVAPARPSQRSWHGDAVVDEYEWLRQKDNPDVIAHLEAENAYCAERTEHLGALRQSIFEEIKARTLQTDLSVAELTEHTDGSRWWYYARTIEGKDYPVYCRVAATDDRTRPDTAGEVPGEVVLLDGNAEAEGKDFFSLGALSVSPNGSLLAYLVDDQGDERFTSWVRNLATGDLYGPIHTDLSYGLSWAGDEWLFYSRVDEAWRPHQVWRHQLATDPSSDALVLQEDDERFWLGVHESRDRSHLVFSAGSKLTGEARLLPTSDPTGEPRIVAPREEGVDYSVELGGDRLFILHNASCPDFELAEAPLDATSRDQWRTVIAGEPGVRLSDVDAYARYVVLDVMSGGLSGVWVVTRDEDGHLWSTRELEFDEPIYDAYSLSENRWESERVRLTYTSLVTPPSVYDLDLGSGERTLLKQTPVLDDPVRGAYDPAAYVQKREWATTHDGVRIPISVVHRADLELDGTNPTLLYGYGSYETNVAPTFSIPRLALLERGFVYAVAHVRGGGEMGRTWYDNGKMLNKKNSFSDFVDAARHLIAAGYTSPEHLAAQGRSAGGLLMGAVANLAPETFRAIHAGVPFVDALTSILMPELPLTVIEWEEWGDPVHDQAVYEYMKSYTPYENIKPVPYPAILATTSLNDTRVLYVEPAKWVARLRATVPQSDDRPILLQTEMTAGHGGVSGRYGRWEQVAFEYAWICDQLGVTE